MNTSEIQSITQRTEEYVTLWKHLAELARLQQKAVGHWQAMLSWQNFFPTGSQLAPASLNQNINPWNISLFQVISGTRGDPQTEVEILTKVASYGSQLGTVIDALMSILPDAEKRKQLNEKDLYAVLKLEHLASEIKRIKES
ncbi:hypothetical protein [Paraburkholderia humisilvae]|uniref:Uncharacterized protein n=1 Tax=Paraburkholderia humisilvae TaxID=627669 RepID=A0A6J5CVA9_9BURK|nr:hypothetical protein [Paraburkholderia humisilvae]CAB3745889.1 hypothetical protein LMG29542_00069 [Paraburkholderia humisilvae]